MTSVSRLSMWEIVSVTVLSRTAMTLLYSLSGSEGEGSLVLYSQVVASLFMLLILFLVDRVVKYGGGLSPIEMLSCKNAVFGKLLQVLLLSVFLMVASLFAIRLYTFLNVITGDDLSGIAILLLILAVVFYCSYMGLRAVCRFSVIVFFLFLLSLVFSAFTLSSEIRMVELVIPYWSTPQEFGKAVYNAVMSNTELILLVSLSYNCKTSTLSRIGGRFVLWTLIILEFLYFFILTTIGVYAQTGQFPFYELLTSAKYALLQRADFIHLMLFIFIGVIKIAVYLLASLDLLSSLLPRVARERCFTALAVTCTVLSTVFYYSEVLSVTLERFISGGLPVFLFMFIVPLAAALLYKPPHSEKK